MRTRARLAGMERGSVNSCSACRPAVVLESGGVVAEGGDVGALGLELRDELGGSDVVAALLADVVVGRASAASWRGAVAGPPERVAGWDYRAGPLAVRSS